MRTREIISLIAALAAQPGFDDGAAARRLEEVQEGQNFVVHGERKVVRDVLRGLLGAVF